MQSADAILTGERACCVDGGYRARSSLNSDASGGPPGSATRRSEQGRPR